jgi:tRNA threonylcarbamoyladenosine biosynthesis protein TsaE
MKQLKIKIDTPEKMIELGYHIGTIAYPNMLLAMNGDLGAGKTTLTKGIGKALNIKRVINSPTFTIMKVYEGSLNLYHLDVYRISDVNQDFELEEYFYLGGVSVVEWADNVKSLIPEDAIKLSFDILEDGTRKVTIEANCTFINKIKDIYGE